MKPTTHTFLKLILLNICVPALLYGQGFVYSSFTGNGEDGLHLLAGYDGKKWELVNNYMSMYEQDSGLMRDPSICVGGDGKYHLVWTTEWWDHTIGISHSNDLIHWSPMERLYVWADYTGPGDEESDGGGWPEDLTIPVQRHEKVRNCWAPEIFYDDSTEEYVIFWATTIDDPTVFSQTWDAGRWQRMNQRIYCITTKDFTTYTPRRFFYAPEDRVVIDACIARTGPADYRMVIKDELMQQLHTCKPVKPFTTWADMPEGYWGPMSAEAFTGPGIIPDDAKAEGPSIVKNGSEWFVYCDYWSVERNGLFSTTDFDTMARLNPEFDAPVWVRHGTVFSVPSEVVDTLLAWTPQDSVAPSAFFRDLFEDTLDTNWTTYGGEWNSSNGYYTVQAGGGVKSIANGTNFTDFTYDILINLSDNNGNAGMVFRVTYPATGSDSYHGYYAGISAVDDELVLGKANGSWSLIESVSMPVDTATWYHVRVTASGGQIMVYCNDMTQPLISAADYGHVKGAIGVRTWHCTAQFDSVTVIHRATGTVPVTFTCKTAAPQSPVIRTTLSHIVVPPGFRGYNKLISIYTLDGKRVYQGTHKKDILNLTSQTGNADKVYLVKIERQ